MAQNEQAEELHRICQECMSKSSEEMVPNPEWGKINFVEAEPKLKITFRLFKDLLRLPVIILPEHILDSIISGARSLVMSIDRIKRFDALEGHPRQRREEIITDINGQVDTFYAEVQHWIPYLAYQHGDVQNQLQELSGAVQQADAILESASKETKAKKTEIDDIVAATREASASAGVAHFSADFMNEAETLTKSAQWWLWVTGGLALVTLGVAYAFLRMDDPSGLYSVIYHSTTKLIILGTLIAATVWCGKIYRALRHQITTNRHRANAIKTFQAFNKAASDDAARDAVLMETTRAIFNSSPSGYLDQETAGSGNEQTRVIELPGRTNKNHLPEVGE